MNIPLETQLLTPEDLLNLPDGGAGFELVDGRLVELHMSVLSCMVAGMLHALLVAYCHPKRLGWVFPQDSEFQYDPDAPRKVRKPDAAFIRLDRLPDSEWRRVSATSSPTSPLRSSPRTTRSTRWTRRSKNTSASGCKSSGS